jgi:hypothetical protein
MKDNSTFVVKIIESCNTDAQLETARRIIDLFLDLLRKDLVSDADIRKIEDDLLCVYVSRQAQISIH